MDVAGVFGLWVVECWSVARGADVGWVLSTAHQGCDSGVVVVWPSHVPRPERGSVAFRMFGHVVLQGAGPPDMRFVSSNTKLLADAPIPPRGRRRLGLRANSCRCMMLDVWHSLPALHC